MAQHGRDLGPPLASHNLGRALAAASELTEDASHASEGATEDDADSWARGGTGDDMDSAHRLGPRGGEQFRERLDAPQGDHGDHGDPGDLDSPHSDRVDP